MLAWLKSILGVPQPAGPAQSLRSFTKSDMTISRDSVALEGDAWRITGSGGSQTVRLFEIKDPGLERCMLTYRAQMKTEGVEGKAYLEMWCGLPGRGEFFSRGLNNAVAGTKDWASYEIPFYLKQGQRPDLIKLNLVIEGSGSAWVKDVQLLYAPLK